MVAIKNWDKFQISIHAPREGSDLMAFLAHSGTARFQSTLPVRGATGTEVVEKYPEYEISIHAPREGSDSAVWRGGSQ